MERSKQTSSPNNNHDNDKLSYQHPIMRDTMNIYQTYRDKPVDNLPPHVVRKFEAYVEEHNLEEQDYYDSVTPFMETIGVCTKTRKDYRNRLRRLLDKVE